MRNFLLPWQQGQSGTRLHDIIKLADPENPCRRYKNLGFISYTNWVIAKVRKLVGRRMTKSNRVSSGKWPVRCYEIWWLTFLTIHRYRLLEYLCEKHRCNSVNSIDVNRMGRLVTVYSSWPHLIWTARSFCPCVWVTSVFVCLRCVWLHKNVQKKRPRLGLRPRPTTYDALQFPYKLVGQAPSPHREGAVVAAWCSGYI